MEISINPEELIAIVQEKVVLWDKRSKDYKHKPLKVSAWREVCYRLIPDFGKLSEKEKQTCGKLVSSKWANLRDAWTRAYQNDDNRAGAHGEASEPFMYREQMSFLQKVAEPKRSKKRAADTYSETPLPSTSKSQKFMELDEKIRQFLDAQIPAEKCDEHPMLSFFRGVMPNVTSFDDDEALEFQRAVLTLIKKMKQQHKRRVYAASYGWQSQFHTGHQPDPTSSASSWSQQSSSTQNSDLDFSKF